MSDLIGFAAARRTARATLHAGWLAGGELRIYTAPRPADADTAVTTQTLLATVPLPDPFGDETDGVLTADAIDPVLIAETGDAAWARGVDASAATVGDYDCGLTDSGAAVEIDNLSLVAGGLLTVVDFTVTEG